MLSTRLEHDAELLILDLSLRPEGGWATGDAASLLIQAEVRELALFEVNAHIRILDSDGQLRWERHAHEDHADAAWLPRGNFAWRLSFPELDLPPGAYRIQVQLLHRRAGQVLLGEARALPLEVERGDMQALGGHGWIELLTLPGGIDIATLAWKKGPTDWFFRHFAHAAEVITGYMLGDSPLLKGRILDLGCGDGITDLGVALRWRPEMLVGIDPFKGFERLPEIMAANGLGEQLPGNLHFEAQDANALSFPDNSFDVVISWGSLEHIAGGYAKALSEVRRVLKPDGLFFVHPGLYYSNYGHHLGEFCNEPFFHLTWPRERIRQMVLATQPNYMDRAGEFATPEQYWQWFTELNPITVSRFERELRAMGFEFYRAALRCEDRVEFSHPALQRHSLVDLSALELYLSCYNRKPEAA